MTPEERALRDRFADYDAQQAKRLRPEPVITPTESDYARSQRETRERVEARQAALIDLAAGDGVEASVANLIIAIQSMKDRFGNPLVQHRGIDDAIERLTGR